MAGHTSDITLERALDSSPSLNRPGRGPGHSGVAPVSKPPSNPAPAQPSSSLPVRNPPPIQLKESKFDQLGSDEGDFTDKLIEEEFPEDWGDNKHEFFDENGWNLLHYSILKGFSNAVTVLVEDFEFDVNKKTHTNMTPLELALQKCCECIDEGTSKETYHGTSKETYHGIAIILMKSDDTIDGVDENVLRLAVNFPVILKRILERHPEFYQSRPGLSSLAKALTGGLCSSYYNTAGFVELMLRQSAGSIVMDLIDKDSAFLKRYTNSVGETALHTAAKLGKVVIVKRLMECGIGESMCIVDKNRYTPIISALVGFEQKETTRDISVKVVFEILSYLATLPTDCSKCIEAIRKPKYQGLPVIEYDIKSGYDQGIIIQAILMLDVDTCKKILCSESFKLGSVENLTIVHLAGRYGISLQKFEEHKDEDKEKRKFKVEYLRGSDETDSKGEATDSEGEATDSEGEATDSEGEATPKLLPCDYAVLYNHNEFLKEAHSFGREEWKHEIDTACRCGNLDAFIFLSSKIKNALTEKKYQRLLRLACQSGQTSIVEYLLDINQRLFEDQKKPSVLMVAADSDAADCVTLLLNHNASVTEVDEKGYNALCRAILNEKKKAVMAILTHSVYGSKALRFCTKKIDEARTNITPMRLLVQHMPDVAKWVLDKQITRTPSGEIIYNYELIDDFDSHVCTFAGPVGHLYRSLVTHKSQNQVDTVNPSVNCHYNKVLVDDSDKPEEYEAYNHMLYLMVKSKDLNILDHLLVGRVINHYWRYVIWQWIVLRFVFLLITVWLTAFTLVLPHPNGDICKGRDGGISGGRRGFLIFSSILLILLSLLSLVVNVYTLYVARLTIFKHTRFRVIFEVVLPILILLFVIGFGNDEWCAQRWQWNVGAFCTCLSWLSVLVTLKGFRLTAAPINMLFAIIKNFMEIIYVPLLLIAAFALPFYMLFTRPGQNFGPYQDIGSALGSLAILFTGEGDYQGQFNDETSVVNFPFASYSIYFLFVIMVGILFNNLLVSLAVGEVSDLRDHAKLEQYRLNVEGIIDGLEIFFPFIPQKRPDTFSRKANIEDNEEYVEAENEWKKAAKESSQFAVSILKESSDEAIQGKVESSDEAIQGKIDHLEATFGERLEKLEKSIKQLTDQINKN